MKMIMAGAPELSWIAMIGKIRRTHGLEWCMYMHIYIYICIHIYIYILCVNRLMNGLWKVYEWFLTVIYKSRKDKETLERLCSPTHLRYFVSHVILSHAGTFPSEHPVSSAHGTPNKTFETLVEFSSNTWVGSALQGLESWFLNMAVFLHGYPQNYQHLMESVIFYTIGFWPWIFFWGHLQVLSVIWLAQQTILWWPL